MPMKRVCFDMHAGILNKRESCDCAFCGYLVANQNYIFFTLVKEASYQTETEMFSLTYKS
jgi:hypothetical protein